MSFKIVVFVKQVPDTDNIRWTEHNTIQREGLDSIINPYDIGAIQLAKNVKFLLPEAEIIVATMGPKQAEAVIKEGIAMGCDRGYILSDKQFAGSDTLATAYVLSQFVKTIIPDCKLIICGQQAVDGDTAQTPSSLAEKLNIPQIGSVTALKSINEEYSVWMKNTCSYNQEIKIQHPCLISTILKNVEILPDIKGYIKAQNTNIMFLNAAEINAEAACTGISGSPTQVKKAFRPVITRQSEFIENTSVDDIAIFLTNEINKCKAKHD